MKVVMTDLKLLAAGSGIGALICSTIAGVTSHACGTVAIIAATVSLFFHFVEGRRT